MEARYAFGEDECDGETCPAVTFGFRASEVNTVIQLYDQFASAKSGVAWGTLSEEEAIEMWGDALEESSEPQQEPRHIENAKYILERMKIQQED